MKRIYCLAGFLFLAGVVFAQEDLPKDYLTKEFHAGRRDALRHLMPANSVAVIFSYPARTFSEDVDYPYHQNPDLYYFTGYKEPNAVLLIFKENQTLDNKTYNEIFFIQKRDPLREIWTGRRLGVEGVKSKLGFNMVFEGSNFKSSSLDFSKFDKIIFDEFPPGINDDPGDPADLYNLIESFKQKINLPEDYDNTITQTIGEIKNRVTPDNMPRFISYIKAMSDNNSKFQKNPVINKFINLKDTIELKKFISELDAADTSKLNSELDVIVGSLREIKTPEEMKLMRKCIDISSIAHAEVMKAIKPDMSETEVQGLQEYVHKKYGAEYVGYPSIVGAGENGCILHYVENSRTKLGNTLLLMDVGAEYHGYSADVTRTVPANGKFSKEQKAIYDLVYEAQEEVFKLCKEGVPFGDLNKKSKEVLGDGLLKLGVIKDKKDVSIYYPHGCSHHLGLDVHDKSNYDTLKANMVITVEPGIYIPANSPCDKKWWSIGVRIEDDVLIGKEKCEILSSLAPRKSDEVEKKIAEKSAVDDFVLPAL